MIDDKYIDAGKDILDGILRSMGFDEFTVYEDQLESRRILAVAVDDHALLIGRKGENLHAVQQVLNAILRTRMLDAPFVTLDIANYKKDRIEKIMRIAEDAAQKVQQYGKEFQLKPMTAFERRIVHMVLADKDDLETESVGQEPYRKVVIKAKVPTDS